MRPPGEIRQVLTRALEHQPGSVRELAMRTQVGFAAAADCFKNMRRAGDVIQIDSVRVPGVCRPVGVYALADLVDCAAPRPAVVERATCWADWPLTTT